MGQAEMRIEAISRMRVLAMTMIIAYHSLLFYTGAWWHFHGIVVPIWVKCARFLDSLDLSMFVFISGYLFGYLYKYGNKYRDKRAFISGKVRKLLIPYFVWGVIMVLIQPSLHSWDQLFTGISHLWFLLMLFGVFCFAYILITISKSESVKWFLLVIVTIYIVWLSSYLFSKHHHLLCIESSLSYFLPFCVGYFVACKNIWNKSNRMLISFSSMALVLLFVYVFFIPAYDDIIDDFLIRVLSYFSIIGILIMLNKLALSAFLNSAIAQIDNLSMGIYIFNQIVINYMLLIPEVNCWLVINYRIGPFVLFLVSFIVPFVLSALFNKTKYLSWMIGGN